MKYLKRFSPFLGVASALVTIISLPITLFNQNKTLGIIVSLSWLFLVTLSLLLILLFAIKSQLKQKYNDGQVVNFIYFKFIALTVENPKLEVTKYIQCKSFYLDQHQYEFKWTGHKVFKITSDLQNVGKISFFDKNTLDTVDLEFKKPIYLNQVQIVQVRFDLDDSTNTALPWLAVYVLSEGPVHFHAELKYKPDSFNEDATIERKKNNPQIGDYPWEFVDHVRFINHSYEYVLPDPELDYHYRMRWTK